MSQEQLYKLVQNVVPRLFPIKMWITEKVPFGKYFAFFIPVAYHKGFLPHANKLTYEQLLEWSILDTFDKFDSQRLRRVSTVINERKWFAEAGLVKFMSIRSERYNRERRLHSREYCGKTQNSLFHNL